MVPACLVGLFRRFTVTGVVKRFGGWLSVVDAGCPPPPVGLLACVGGSGGICGVVL